MGRKLQTIYEYLSDYTEKEILHSAEEAGAGYGETTEKN